MKWLPRILGNGSCEFQEYSGSLELLRLLWNFLDTRDGRDRKVLCAPRSRGETVRKKQAVVDNFSGTWNCRRAPQRTWVKFPCFIYITPYVNSANRLDATILFSSRNKSFIDWNRLGFSLRGKDVQLIEVKDKCEFCYFVNVISRIVISPSFSIICCRNK